MCFSAIIQREKALIERNYQACTDVEAFEKFHTLSEQSPKLFKPIDKNEKIFSGYYAPVITMKNAQRVIIPMRYGVHPQDNARFPGTEITYNARSDNLHSRFWQNAFMINHGLVIIKGFYEWVEVRSLVRSGKVSLDEITSLFQQQSEKRKAQILKAGKKYAPTKTETAPAIDRKIIIRFMPENRDELVVPVIYNYSLQPEKSPFPGFAIITGEPNPEIQNAGHNRMPVCLSHETFEEWLKPEKHTPQSAAKLLQNPAKEYFNVFIENE